MDKERPTLTYTVLRLYSQYCGTQKRHLHPSGSEGGISGETEMWLWSPSIHWSKPGGMGWWKGPVVKDRHESDTSFCCPWPFHLFSEKENSSYTLEESCVSYRKPLRTTFDKNEQHDGGITAVETLSLLPVSQPKLNAGAGSSLDLPVHWVSVGVRRSPSTLRTSTFPRTVMEAPSSRQPQQVQVDGQDGRGRAQQ